MQADIIAIAKAIFKSQELTDFNRYHSIEKLSYFNVN